MAPSVRGKAESTAVSIARPMEGRDDNSVSRAVLKRLTLPFYAWLLWLATLYLARRP